MLVYLVRHAQTASSAVDSFNGQRELPLTEQGREQARKLGERLRGVRFAAVYRSPLGRTAQTASKFRMRCGRSRTPAGGQSGRASFTSAMRFLPSSSSWSMFGASGETVP